MAAADAAIDVIRLPLKMPVLTPVSVKLTVSTSPVLLLVTVTDRVCTVLVLVFWSPSVTWM